MNAQNLQKSSSTHGPQQIAAPTTASRGASASLRDQARTMDFASGEALMKPAENVQMKTAATTATANDKDAELGPGDDMRQGMVDDMEEFNKSPALSGGDKSGRYNVGYHPAKPNVADFDLSKMSEELAYRTQLMTAEDYKNGRVYDPLEEFRHADHMAPKSDKYTWTLEKNQATKDKDNQARGLNGSRALDQMLSGKGDSSDSPADMADKATRIDCATAVVLIQLKALRDALGDDLFNMVCKLHNGPFVSPNPRLTPLKYFLGEVEMYALPAAEKGKAGADTKGLPGARNGLKLGDAVYFKNYSKYKDVDPEGAWHGEHCLFMGIGSDGNQLFSGFGIPSCNEFEMNKHLMDAYNAAVRARDGEGAKTITLGDFEADGAGLELQRPKTEGDNVAYTPAGTRLSDAMIEQCIRTKKLPVPSNGK